MFTRSSGRPNESMLRRRLAVFQLCERIRRMAILAIRPAPSHVILNLAVGGMWSRSGGGIDDGIFPQQMLIDFVRVYELADSKS